MKASIKLNLIFESTSITFLLCQVVNLTHKEIICLTSYFSDNNVSQNIFLILFIRICIFISRLGDNDHPNIKNYSIIDNNTFWIYQNANTKWNLNKYYKNNTATLFIKQSNWVNSFSTLPWYLHKNCYFI